MEEKKEVVESTLKHSEELGSTLKYSVGGYPEARYHTLEINHLAAALAKAQGAYKKLIPNQFYKGEKFANMDAIREATREALSTNGLSFIQRDEILNDGTGTIIFKSILMHESGQWISSWARIVPDRTLKETMVLYETTARLHATKLLGIAPTVNDPYLFDDNGEHQSERQLVEDLQRPASEIIREREGRIKLVDDRQYRSLENEIAGDKEIAKKIMDKHNIATLEDLPEEFYLKTIAWIRRVKEEAKNELARKRR